MEELKVSLYFKNLQQSNMLTQSTKAGLIEALRGRSNKLRRTMLEVVLIAGVNDSDKEAQLLARFAQSIMVGSGMNIREFLFLP